MQKRKQKAFTLIELLMVIAIIGILAGILIPTVGTVRDKAKVAASKSQLLNYVNSIQLFKGEYKFLPFADKAAAGPGGELYNIKGDGRHFRETLSGRDLQGQAITTGNNRRSVQFHTFLEAELFYNGDSTDPNRIVDRFNNENITIAIDVNGDGLITLPNPQFPDQDKAFRTLVTAFVEDDSVTEDVTPDYYLYD